MVVKPNSTSAIVGTNITLHCLARGNPKVEYEWHKVGSHDQPVDHMTNHRSCDLN